MNSFFFQDYVEQALVPELRLGDIVVMDNLGSHKASGPAIESAGASLLCLSTHSPDFNPAEPASANWKPRSERQPSAASTGSGLPSARHRHHRSSQMGRASELPQLCRSPPRPRACLPSAAPCHRSPGPPATRPPAARFLYELRRPGRYDHKWVGSVTA
ncbi:transposase [Paeniroseomonas aquatica]|uniref:transposase n=1 Tax=Paeniroseomonas aquatica TaxID=373043 RepID=UPI00338DF37C